MSFSLPSFGSSKRDQVLAIDLGTRASKGVLFQRKGDKFTLARYAIQDAPIYEKGFSADLLSEHLKHMVGALQPKTKQVMLSIGNSDSLLRNAELPLMPVSEIRQMLKLNSKTY